MSYLSLLDMLTCCLGAMLVLWLISNAAIRTSKGISPGTVLRFEVQDTSRVKGNIGVRVQVKGELRWAGDRTPIEPPIIIDPAEEGADSSVTVILTGDYDDADRLYLFVHQLNDGTALWPSTQELKVNVTKNDARLNEVNFTYEKLFYSAKLNDFKTDKGNLNWE